MKASMIVLVMFALIFFTSCGDTSSPTEPEIVVDQEDTGNIKGIVISAESDQPLERVSIYTQPPSQRVLTTQDGSFSIPYLEPGRYTVVAEKYGLKTTSVEVYVLAKHETRADIILQ